MGEIEVHDSSDEGVLGHINLENKSSDWVINIKVENHKTIRNTEFAQQFVLDH